MAGRDYISEVSSRFNSAIERNRNNQQASSSNNLVERLRIFRQTGGENRQIRRRPPTRLSTFRVGLLLHPDMVTFHPQKAEAIKKVQVPVSFNSEEFRQHLRSAFPRLGSADFDLARVDAQKKIQVITVSPLTPSVIKASRILKRSALYIMPKTTIEVQNGEHNPGHDSILGEVANTLEPQDEDENSRTSAEEREGLILPSTNAIDRQLADGDLSNEPYEQDLKVLLNVLSSKLLPEGQESNQINVCRDSIMDGATRAFTRRSFRPEAKMSIVFMDAYDLAEGSVDEGGPSREFYRLLMLGIKNSPLFFGEDQKMLALDTHALGKRLYTTYGRMIAVALVHGGVSPSFFSERLYNSLCGIAVSPPTLEDVSDPDLKDKLRKIKDAADITAARMAIEDASDVLSLLGSLRYVSLLEGRDELVQCATTFYVEGRTKEALEQFAEGLETFGLLDLLRAHPNTFREVFSSPTTTLKACDLVSLFQADLATPGSNHWRVETRVEGFWRDFLIEVQDGEHPISLRDILVFASGADRVPILGFPTHPKLTFNHQCDRRYPEANTCLIHLRLPIHSNYEDFAKFMVDGMIQAPTFGVA